MLGLTALVLYLLSRSASLDDFDSYSFVLALKHFDIHLQQPQPPGFPVYVALGRLFSLFFPDPRVALTTLSAVGGAASVAMMCWLGQLFYGRDDVGILAGLVWMVFPIHWLTAGKALSDVPGLALVLTSVALLWAGRKNWRLLIAGAAVLGLSLGVRPQSALPALITLVWVLIPYVRKRKWKRIAWIGAAGLAAVLVWLIPTAAVSGGWWKYYAMVSAHGNHVMRSDSLLHSGPLNLTSVRARLMDFVETWAQPTLNISVYGAGGVRVFLMGFAVGLFTVAGLLLTDWKRSSAKVLLLWAASLLVLTFLFVSTRRMRLLLPIFPPLVLLVTSGWTRLGSVRWLVVGTAIIGLAARGAPLVETLTHIDAPPAQAIHVLQWNFDPADTLVAAAGSYRAMQVEAPQYPCVYRYRFDAEEVREEIVEGQYTHIVVLDRDDFSEVMDALTLDGAYIPISDKQYTRDPRVHWQHSEVRVQVLARADSLTAADLAPPEDGLIDIGGEVDGAYLGEGWFRAEDISGAMARWTGDADTSRIRVALPEADTTITLEGLAFMPVQSVTLWVNGELIDTQNVGQGWTEVTFNVPGDLLDAEIDVIGLEHALVESPFEASGGSSSDQRRLAVAYDWIRVVSDQ